MGYEVYMKRTFIPFTTSRLMPYCGITVLLAVVAHNRASDLELIAYVLAIYSVLSVTASMMLAATGNLVAEHSDNTQEKALLFRGGFSIVLLLALVSLALGLLIVSLMVHLPGAQIGVSKIQGLAAIYVAAIPLLVINTFLQFYHEACGEAHACSKLKAGSTVLSLCYIAVAYSVADAEGFIDWAMGYFFCGELLLLLGLLKLSCQRGLSFCPRYCALTARNILTLGLPIALGLAGQKLYFYLLNEKLAMVLPALLAQLSVCMSGLGLLMIPIIAYCQAHSLYVSSYRQNRSILYLKGLLGVCGLVVLLLSLLSVTGKFIFYWLGRNIIPFNGMTFITLACLLGSGSVLSLSTSHLRGLRDTLAPQMMMNIIMLSILIPIIYFVRVSEPDVHFYLRLQSAGLLAGFLFLQLRIRQMQLKKASVTR